MGGLFDQVTSPEALFHGWDRVSRNGGAAGADGVGLEEFARALESNLRSLRQELQSGQYTPLPARRVWIAEPDKKRPIDVRAVRDRVAEQALYRTLLPLWEPHFPAGVYGYRPRRSALGAVQRVEEHLAAGRSWVLEADIAKFFERIDHELLLGALGRRIQDERVLDLVGRFLQAPVLDGMELCESQVGTCQGGSLSPLLSNVYLGPLDQAFAHRAYIRYADDFVVPCSSREEAQEQMEKAREHLTRLRLELHPEKTRVVRSSEGFVFLGFVFGPQGKGPERRALETLAVRLEEWDAAHCPQPGEEEIVAARRVVNGWAEYFGPPEGVQPRSRLGAVVLGEALLRGRRRESAGQVLSLASSLPPQGALAEELLAKTRLAAGDLEGAMTGFSRLLSQGRGEAELARLLRVPGDRVPELAGLLEQGRTAELVETLAEAGSYALAARLAVRRQREEAVSEPTLELGEAGQARFLELFSGREGMHAVEEVVGGRRRYRKVEEPLDEAALASHLTGDRTLGIYLLRANHTVRLAVFDLDIAREELLRATADEEAQRRLRRAVQEDTQRLQAFLRAWEVPHLVEDSGHRGYHLWLFFEEALPAAMVRRIAAAAAQGAQMVAAGVTWEIFPREDRLKEGQDGSLIKLPWGIHGITGRRGLWVGEDWQPREDQEATLLQAEPVPWDALDRLAQLAGERPARPASRLPEPDPQEAEKLRQGASPEVARVLEHCRLLGYLADKAATTRYLNHQERLTVCNTLGHLGESGRQFVHRVMACCMNYDPRITQRYVDRMPEFPVSCGKLREHFAQLTAGLGCDCRLSFPSGGYPSPVLWAAMGPKPAAQGPSMKGQGQGAASPEKQLRAEVETILQKMTELRRQLTGVRGSLETSQRRLGELMEQAGVERLEVSQGTLVRREGGGWRLEL
jgi:group II intron reverse transcriptase/maturase